jgi:hypothetical protein
MRYLIVEDRLFWWLNKEGNKIYSLKQDDKLHIFMNNEHFTLKKMNDYIAYPIHYGPTRKNIKI